MSLVMRQQFFEYDERTIDPATYEESTLEMTWRAASGPWIVELGSAELGASIRLEHGRMLILGSSRSADVRIADRRVSSRHCSIAATSSGVIVEDLKSKNGVFVGSARVTLAHLPSTGGSIVIGNTTIVVRPDRGQATTSIETPIPGLIGSSLAIQRVAADIRRHARMRAPVLILGESGTGKDVAAQALHQLSGRTGPYLPLNVGAIAESLADAELFGHRRGAFTGAVAARPGAFEQARGGSLFLDEIAELPASLQVRLLRVVEDGIIRPLGCSEPVKVDVRILAATWAPLDQRVIQGRFRADLLHRLSMMVIRLPPLRQRKTDIPALCQSLLERLAAEVGEKRVSSAALARLVEHDWPGNVRELGSALYRAAVASDGPIIDVRHLDFQGIDAGPCGQNYLEPAAVIALYEQHNRNATAAARAARVARSTFRCWLDRARSDLGEKSNA